MDSVRKPKTPMGKQQSRTAPVRQHTNSPKPFAPEMKVWFSVIGSSLVIVAVWIATFSMPKSIPKNSSNSSTGQVKEILSELRNSIQNGMRVVDQQKTILSELASNTNSSPSSQTLSNEELKALAEQLVGTLNATTTTSTVPQITPASQQTSEPKPTSKLP